MSEPIWSTGGTGGEHAVTEDLQWAAHVLREAGGDIAGAQLELARRCAALGLDQGVGHAGAREVLAYAARALAPSVAEELDRTSRRLAAVAGAFLDAEAAARERLSMGERLGAMREDLSGDAWWLARVAGAAVVAVTPVGIGALASGHDSAIARVLPHEAPPSTGVLTRDAVEGALALPDYELLVACLDVIISSPLLQWLTAWRGRLTSRAVQMAPATSVETVMRDLLATEQAPGGAVRIERWTDSSGATRRIVFIPGTEDWLNVTDNPFDSRADLELMLGRLPDAAQVVAAALAADGARPGDPVMLAGHSLGGMVATALAANADFARRFTVTGLVTAGSPVGRVTLPPSVYALHLEGTRDIVPGLDGAPNPDTPTRVTVHHDARESEVEELDGAARTVGSAHNLNTYAQTARLVDNGLSPSTDAWLSAQRGYLEPQGQVTVTEYAPDG